MTETKDSARRKTGLGMGLSAILGETRYEDPGEAVSLGPLRALPVTKIKPGRYQPRRAFDETAIDELAQSIRGQGMLQPILVRPLGDGSTYEIVAGERRWRAAQRAQLHEIPVIIRTLSDQEALEVALVENLQRQDLSPLEEADGYRRLMEEFGHTQEALAGLMGKSRSHVANMVRLLSLPDGVKTMLDDGRLSAGHARAVLTTENPEALAAQVVARQLNVRQTEALAKSMSEARHKAKTAVSAPSAAGKDADTAALERDLSLRLGLKVGLQVSGNKGELRLGFRSLEQLDDLIAKLSA